MDEFDTFCQQLDAETLLKQHGLMLASAARDILQTAANAKVAGLILTPDSHDAESFRQAIATATGKAVPPGLMVGIVPRPMVEPLLRKRAEVEIWLEEPAEPQSVLPVVVSTRDGFRFGYFGSGTRPTRQGVVVRAMRTTLGSGKRDRLVRANGTTPARPSGTT